MIAIAPELTLTPLEALDVSGQPVVVALDELEDPQNFGAVLRSSVALGATAVSRPERPLGAAHPGDVSRVGRKAVEHARLGSA